MDVWGKKPLPYGAFPLKDVPKINSEQNARACPKIDSDQTHERVFEVLHEYRYTIGAVGNNKPNLQMRKGLNNRI
jgi:hypothetical protein